jgi:hypothetical protein
VDIEEERLKLTPVLIGPKKRLMFKEFLEILEITDQWKTHADLKLFMNLKEIWVSLITMELTEAIIQETNKNSLMQLSLRKVLSNLLSKSLKS